MSTDPALPFDYESKTWGAHEVRVSPTYLGALRLEYCLMDLNGISGAVLEVGCGGGGMIRAIGSYRPDLKVFGCDISRNAIRVAYRDGQGLHVSGADAYNLPFASKSFNAYVMFDVLEHVVDPRRILEEAHRVLKPQGLLHIFVPCEGETHTVHGLLVRLGWRAKEIYGGHIQQFSLPALKDLLELSGFTGVGSRWSCHIFNQIVDVAYFTGLSVRRKNFDSSVEGYLETSEGGLWRSLVALAKAGVAAASYYESRLFSWLPGSGAHLIGWKSDSERAQSRNG